MGENRRASHVWLRHDALFAATGKDGAEQLTDGGKTQLDAALAPSLSRLADSVVIVEGYSDASSPAVGYIQARARAALVREHLVQRFHLDPGLVGVMALGGEASGSPQGATWNGVALAVFVEK